MSFPQPSSGGVAVVTGASSGIGEALAEVLAERGYPLLLVARRRDLLDALAKRLADEHGAQVEVMTSDLAEPMDREALCTELAGRHVSILCNNAGQTSWGDLRDLDPERERQQVELNVVSLHALTLAVLPGMLERGEGVIEFTGSIAGVQPMPGSATYSATKAFVNSFGESLHQELKGTGVSCTVVAPGPVRTGILDAADIGGIEGDGGDFVWLTARRVAEETFAAMERGDRILVPGIFAKLNALSGRYLPKKLMLPLTQQIGRHVVSRGRSGH